MFSTMGKMCMWMLSIVGMFYLNTTLIHGDSYEDFLTTTLPNVCPYTAFCSISPRKQLNGKKATTCCKPCSCELDCRMIGNCCPDSPALLNDIIPMPPVAKCVAPIEYEWDSDGTEALVRERMIQMYFIISTCPAQYNNKAILQNCKNGSRKTIQKHAIVSDDKGHVFANRYCAKCNGVEKYTVWDLKMICDAAFETLSNLLDVRALDEHVCVLYYSPPKTDAILKSTCYPITYNQCNVTGKWNNLDLNIKRACESTISPYVQPTVFNENIYANPFCYLCNEASESQMLHICPLSNDVNDRQFHLPARFTAFVNLRSVREETTHVTKPKQCNMSEIYDYRFETCRPLHCPIAMKAKDGQCIDIFKETNGLPICVQIDASYADEDTRDFFSTEENMPNKEHIENIAVDLFVDIGMLKQSCGACTSTALMKNNNTGIIFLLELKTTPFCQAATLISMVNQWEQKTTAITLSIGAQSLMFHLRIAYEVQYTLFTSLECMNKVFHQRLTILDKLYSICAHPIFLTKMFYCPHIDITQSEYGQMMSSNNHSVDLSDFIPVVNENDKDNTTTRAYGICIDKYLAKKNVGIMAAPYWEVVLIGLTMLVVLLLCQLVI